MIDPNTGEIRFPGESITFGPMTTREQFVHSDIGQRSEMASRVHGDSFALPRVEIQGHPFFRILYFLGGRLHQVFMGSAHPQFGESWSDWSQEKEIARKRFHQSVLTSIFGMERERYEFPWGSVCSYYDVKGDASQIAVTYVA